MSQQVSTTIAVMGIDIGKNSLHIVGLEASAVGGRSGGSPGAEGGHVSLLAMASGDATASLSSVSSAMPGPPEKACDRGKESQRASPEAGEAAASVSKSCAASNPADLIMTANSANFVHPGHLAQRPDSIQE